MVFVKNVKFCEAECGEYIWSFAKELIDYRKTCACDVVGKFNDVYIEVKQQTTEDDVVHYYMQYR